jgi:hypothetical protein
MEDFKVEGMLWMFLDMDLRAVERNRIPSMWIMALIVHVEDFAFNATPALVPTPSSEGRCAAAFLEEPPTRDKSDVG